MVNGLIEFDKWLFLILNSYYSNYCNYFFWQVTQSLTWLPFYVVLLFVLVKNQPKGWWFNVLALVVMVVLCDQISNNVIKVGIERLRPSYEPTLNGMVHLVAGYKGGEFGFVSSHATNSFGLAIFTTLLFRHRLFTITIFSWAVLNCYSRIYLGLHYLGDIIGGMLLGLFIGYGCYTLSKMLFLRFTKAKDPSCTPTLLSELVFQKRDIQLLVFTIFVTVAILLISAKSSLKLAKFQALNNMLFY